MAGKSAAKKMKKLCFIFFNLLFFWGLVAGKSAVTKLKKYVFIFFRLIFFGGLAAGKSATKKWTKCMFFLGWEGRAGCGKIGEKKLNKKNKYIYIHMFIFLEGWSRENLRQKNWTNIIYIFFFWRAGHGKLGDIIKLFWFVFRRSHQKKARKKKPASNIAFIFQTFICCLDLGPENECLKSRWKSVLFCLFVFFELALETSKKKTLLKVLQCSGFCPECAPRNS